VILNPKRTSFPSRSPEETRELGYALGRLLGPGDVVCLFGELGSGKTCFVQGVAQGMEIRDQPVTSPSYTIVNEYQGRTPLFHIDLYRIGKVRNLRDLGFEEMFYGQGVTIVEWADRMADQLPDERMDIRIGWLAPSERNIVMEAFGSRAVQTLERLVPFSD
jgi:tRNA threonylcarbamoyladenosine biosynthesis protein TsaE